MEILKFVLLNDAHRPYQVKNVWIQSKHGLDITKSPITGYRSVRYKGEVWDFPVAIEESESLIVKFKTYEIVRHFSAMNPSLVSAGNDPDYPLYGFYEAYGVKRKINLPENFKHRIYPFNTDS